MASSMQATRAGTSQPRQPPASRATQRPVDPLEVEGGPLVGRWGLFAALPPHQRRALVVCRAWLISGYGGIALVAAGIDRLLSTSHLSFGVLLIALGAALAVIGFARAHKRIANESEWSA